jgi:hypothetical protein
MNVNHSAQRPARREARCGCIATGGAQAGAVGEERSGPGVELAEGVIGIVKLSSSSPVMATAYSLSEFASM